MNNDRSGIAMFFQISKSLRKLKYAHTLTSKLLGCLCRTRWRCKIWLIGKEKQIKLALHSYFPSECVNCATPIESSRYTLIWCEQCYAEFEAITRCPRCGLPSFSDKLECGQCLSHPPHWKALRCIGGYHGQLMHHVQRLKFSRDYWIAQELALLLARQTSPTQLVLRPTAFIPVPSYWSARFKRGYNQSELLAKELQIQWWMQFSEQVTVLPLFVHTQKPQQQKRLNKQQRQRNIRTTFALHRNAKQRLGEHKHVAIIDDIVTSGATVAEMSRLLLTIGVERVDVYCICRTPLPNCP